LYYIVQLNFVWLLFGEVKYSVAFCPGLVVYLLFSLHFTWKLIAEFQITYLASLGFVGFYRRCFSFGICFM